MPATIITHYSPFHARTGYILRCPSAGALDGIFMGWSREEAAASLAELNGNRRRLGLAEIVVAA